MSKRQIKNKLKKANKTKKVGRKGERKGPMKTKKNRKNRISFKKMSKRKLKSTLKKAKRKIRQQLKYISMKGGAGDGKMHKEVPQDPNQSEESIESTKAAVIMTMEVVFSALFAITLGGEILSLRTLIGGLLVVISMYTIVFHESKPVND